MRCAHSIAMPHGASVGGPYSSWLKKLPQRAMPCAKSVPGDHSIEREPQVELLPAGVDDDPDERPEHSAVQAQARVGRQEDRDRVVLVEVPLVDHVVQPTTQEGEDADDQQRVPDVGPGNAAALGLDLRDQQQHCQRDHVADAVPADGDRAEVDQRGIGGYRYQREHGGSIPILAAMTFPMDTRPSFAAPVAV